MHHWQTQLKYSKQTFLNMFTPFIFFFFQGKLIDREGKCLQLQDSGNEVAMEECNNSAEQEWIFSQHPS